MPAGVYPDRMEARSEGTERRDQADFQRMNFEDLLHRNLPAGRFPLAGTTIRLIGKRCAYLTHRPAYFSGLTDRRSGLAAVASGGTSRSSADCGRPHRLSKATWPMAAAALLALAAPGGDARPQPEPTPEEPAS